MVNYNSVYSPRELVDQCDKCSFALLWQVFVYLHLVCMPTATLYLQLIGSYIVFSMVKTIIYPFWKYSVSIIGIYRRKCLEGQRRADNYWILNTCSAERACISPSEFIMYNGEHSFLFVAMYIFIK